MSRVENARHNWMEMMDDWCDEESQFKQGGATPVNLLVCLLN